MRYNVSEDDKHLANKKDTEKRDANWNIVKVASFALITGLGVAAGVLGGKFDFKLPSK